MPRQRRVPQRTCVVCRAVLPKRALMRIVRTPEGAVTLDPRGKLSGRGAYLCVRQECFGSRRARQAVSRALQVSLGEADWERLTDQLATLASERSSALSREDG
ncbi:MAG: YlxR family protein [Anaerolineae bacterium]|nr:YlxR family protein [Anaerolineae bacterium]